MTSYSKLEKIAEACNVDVQTGSEDGHEVIELWGRKEDLQKMRPLIEDDYLIRGGDRPSADGEDVLYLYSGRVRWDTLGY